MMVSWLAASWACVQDRRMTIRQRQAQSQFTREYSSLRIPWVVQVLLLAQEAGVLKLGTISLDGTKVHADASKRKAVSYPRLLEVEAQLRTEVEELFALSEQSDQPEAPDGLVVRQEMARREDRLARLAQAKAVIEARATERAAAEQAEYETKLAQRQERERTTGRRPGGRPPTPPVPGPRDGDQYNFPDPESRIMKSSTHAGFEQDDNAQVAVDQASLLIVGWALSNHPNDRKARRTHAGGHAVRDWHTRGGGAGCWLLWPRYLAGMCQTWHRALHRDGAGSASSQLAAAVCTVA